MSEPTEDELVAAKAALERRFVEKSTAAIADPRLRTVAERYRDGTMTASEVVKEFVFSPAAVRGLDRVGSKLMAMTAAQRESLLAKVDGAVREIAIRDRRAAERARIADARAGDEEASNEDR